MRINHNIAALNTYNKLTANTAATSKSLEKLSSGLKINKAGDNAAGLAISEKMRGQIRGLDQASTNASDAISMINTAEGALSETHSILQRMRELAVQSSNDTNVTIDRDEIQKEMNQLTSEINRIGNTTEFNTQKLLNGGGATSSDLEVTTTTAGGQVGRVSTSVTTVTPSSSDKSSVSVKSSDNRTFTIQARDASDDFSDMKLRLVSGATSGITKTTSGVIQITATAAMTVNSIQRLVSGSSLLTGGAVVTLTSGDGSAVAGGGAITGASLTSFDNLTSGSSATSFSNGTEQKGVYSFKITEAFSTIGATVSFKLNNSLTPNSNTTITLTATEGDSTANVSTGVAAGTFVIGKDATERLTTEQQAANIVATLNDTTAWDIDGGGGNDNISDLYDVRVDGDTIVFTEKTANGSTALSSLATGGVNNAVQGVSTYLHEEVVGVGSSIMIDGEEIEVVDGAGAGDDLKIQNGTAIRYSSTDTVATQMDALRGAIASNSVLNTKYTAGGVGSTLTLTQTATNSSNAVPEMKISTVAGQTFEANFQIGANTAQSMTVEINDMRSSALHITGDAASSTRTAKNGAVATFSTDKEVTDGTTNEGAEYALDVSTHEKATAAISVINDAIEAVSAERSKLGSYQNRLEHTINNLGTSSENLTTAESRIRDVDMAKEMMDFTKNNILSQAAQSMLAQANQQPQGVLQLLQ